MNQILSTDSIMLMKMSEASHNVGDMEATQGFSTASEAVATLATVLDALVPGLPMPSSHRERLELIARLREISGRVSALTSVWLAEADELGSAKIVMGTSTTDWLTRKGKADPKEAAGLLHSGRDLAGAPQLRSAALDGTVTPQQMRGIRKTLKELPAEFTAAQLEKATDSLVGKAATMTPRELGMQARAITTEVAPEQLPSREAELRALEQQRKRAVQRRRLSMVRDGDGSWLIDGSLPVLEGEKLRKLIAGYAASEQSKLKARNEQDHRTWEQRNADALVALIDNHGAAAPLPGLIGDKPRIVVLMNEKDLHDRAEQAGLLTNGEQIDPGTLRRLSCDAEITPVVLDGNSVPIDVGSSHRTVTPEIRLALSVRDGGCRFPGCDAPDEACQAHHADPWRNRRHTSVASCVLLCPTHHAMVEPKRFWDDAAPDQWQVVMDDGQPRFIPPRGLLEGEAQPGAPPALAG